MKILKHGKVEMRKFVCPKCGCIFVTTPADEQYEFPDHYQCPQDGCGWYIPKTGYSEPYEEPTQSDKERLIKLLREWRRSRSEEFPVSCANYLIARGVTFKEDANGQN